MTERNNIEILIADKGFTEYKFIDPKNIVVAQWVRVKCEFGCSGYGSGTCPPNTPSVADCRSFFSEYGTGVIVRLNKFADKNAYPSEWSREMTDKLLSAERELFLSGYQKAFLLNQTCCTLCDDCSGDRLRCKQKKLSRPSPESFAVDVYSTVRNAGIKINVVSDSPAGMNRIAILLVE